MKPTGVVTMRLGVVGIGKALNGGFVKNNRTIDPPFLANQSSGLFCLI
ncbi:MAG: hypothetical protein FWF52_00240 [Candidatus Azobacteroides sp.]|nr:hypothetical protein [Candidatus Azobacteroides sp.]